MLPMGGVKSVLNFTEREILTRLDAGTGPRWVFDISLNPKQARKRELRFLADGVADFAAGHDSSLEWADVFDLLIPHQNRVVTAPEVEHVLNSCDLHVQNLGQRGCLKVFRPGRPGCKGAGLFFRNSFQEFLKQRLVS